MTERKIIRVADVMEQNYVIVDGVATVADALALLKEKNAHFLLVAKRHEDDEFGAVMVSDIAKHVLAGTNQHLRDHVQAGFVRDARNGHPLLRAALPPLRDLHGTCDRGGRDQGHRGLRPARAQRTGQAVVIRAATADPRGVEALESGSRPRG